MPICYALSGETARLPLNRNGEQEICPLQKHIARFSALFHVRAQSGARRRTLRCGGELRESLGEEVAIRAAR